MACGVNDELASSSAGPRIPAPAPLQCTRLLLVMRAGVSSPLDDTTCACLGRSLHAAFREPKGAFYARRSVYGQRVAGCIIFLVILVMCGGVALAPANTKRAQPQVQQVLVPHT